MIGNDVSNKRNDVYVLLKVINIQEILYHDYRFFVTPTGGVSKFVFDGYFHLLLKWRYQRKV